MFLEMCMRQGSGWSRIATAAVLATLLVSAAPASAQLGPPLPSDVVHMQIVAHEDDDFLFMNPDLSNAIAAGHGIVTVYLTAGQASGAAANAEAGTPEMCAAEFAAARQRGIRAAYARMAGLANPAFAAWNRELIVPDVGVAWPHTVERYTLAAIPRIQLVFLNIPDGGAAIASCAYGSYTYALTNMFAFANYMTDTIVPDCGNPSSAEGFGGAVTNCGEYYYPNPFVCSLVEPCSPAFPWQNYDRAGVIAVLRGLVDAHQPQVVRTLDPRPFQKPGPPSNPCPVSGYDVCFDNADHTAAANFVDEVLSDYHGPHGSDRFDLVHYKGYSAANYPFNVGFAEYQKKKTTGETYANTGPDGNYLSASYDEHYHTMYERYPGSTVWMEQSSNGNLVALSVQGRRTQMWYEPAPGAGLVGPVPLPSDGPIAGTSAPTAPHVTLVKRPDGRLAIFALRAPISPSAPADVVTSVEVGGTLPRFGPWTSLGAPDDGTFLGPPAAGYDAFGRTFVFAKSSLGRLVYRFEQGGAWSGWLDLSPGLPDIVDGIAAITKDDGLVSVFVTLRSGAIAAFQQSGDGFTRDLGLAISGAASAPTVAKNADGRLEIFYRERVDGNDASVYGRVWTAWVNSAGAWAGPAVLYGDAGVGPIAAIRRGGSGHILIFERNTDDRISFTQQQAPNDVFALQWGVLGAPLLVQEYPAAATDALGRVVVAAKVSDGELYFRRELSAAAVGSFDAWTPAPEPGVGLLLATGSLALAALSRPRAAARPAEEPSARFEPAPRTGARSSRAASPRAEPVLKEAAISS